jgi:hypothetical protein
MNEKLAKNAFLSSSLTHVPQVFTWQPLNCQTERTRFDLHIGNLLTAFEGQMTLISRIPLCSSVHLCTSFSTALEKFICIPTYFCVLSSLSTSSFSSVYVTLLL